MSSAPFALPEIIAGARRRATVSPAPSGTLAFDAPQTIPVVQAPAARLAGWLAEHELPVSLVYIDPPFAAERDFHFSTGDRRLAYSDKWASLDAYLASMREVLEQVRAALLPEGSLLLHCDHRASPYLAILCDEIFGMGDRGPRGQPGFRNELIWSYGLGGSSARCYPKKHDTILWYSKGAAWNFDPPMVPATSNRLAGQLKKAPDVLNIPTINNMAGERCGYPTQKPLALLELLVKAHTRPGDLVVDLFSGSGTTAVAAIRSGRHAIVGDIGVEGIRVTAERIAAAGGVPTIYDAEVGNVAED